MTLGSRDFVRLVEGLGPWLIGGLLALAAILLTAAAVGWLRVRPSADRLHTAAELTSWTFFAVCLEGIAISAYLTPKFQRAAEVAHLPAHPAHAAIALLGWTAQSPLTSASVAFMLFCASLGLAVASWTEAGATGRRVLIALSSAGALALTAVLAWGLLAMLGGQAEMLRLAAAQKV